MPCYIAGEDLRHALDCTLASKPLERRVKNSIGCNIKVGAGMVEAWAAAQGLPCRLRVEEWMGGRVWLRALGSCGSACNTSLPLS